LWEVLKPNLLGVSHHQRWFITVDMVPHSTHLDSTHPPTLTLPTYLDSTHTHTPSWLLLTAKRRLYLFITLNMELYPFQLSWDTYSSLFWGRSFTRAEQEPEPTTWVWEEFFPAPNTVSRSSRSPNSCSILHTPSSHTYIDTFTHIHTSSG